MSVATPQAANCSANAAPSPPDAPVRKTVLRRKVSLVESLQDVNGILLNLDANRVVAVVVVVVDVEVGWKKRLRLARTARKEFDVFGNRKIKRQ